jgi:cytoskeletal protein CcmA (bactofilin family)
MTSKWVGMVGLAALLACGGGGSDDTSGSTGAGSTGPGPTTGGPPTPTTGPATTDPATTDAPTSADPTTTDAPTSTGASTGTTGASTGTTEPETGETSGTSTGEMDFCAGEGGILLPGDEVTCTGDLGKKTFLFALCSCTDLTANNKLTTDSFDSEMMGMMPMDGGSVGVNGKYSAASQIDIGGALWVDGTIQTNNSHEVAQDLQCGGDVTATAMSHVGADAFVEGDILALNQVLTIDGDLHLQNGKMNNAAVVAGQVIKEQVSVATPCDCEDPIDIAGIVQYFQSNNDNAANGVDAADLTQLSEAKVLELPCGRFFFDEVTSNHELKIVLTGRTVIAIAGGIVNAGSFTVELGPGAELDLFIAGDATLNNVAAIGDPERPAATRVYAAGAVQFANKFTLGANLYQPNAVFTANNAAEIWGSLFVGGLQLASPVIIHYDQAILELDGCEDPGSGCGDCHDCANPTPACKDGACAPCEVDSDCCPPLVCDAGICKAILPG